MEWILYIYFNLKPHEIYGMPSYTAYSPTYESFDECKRAGEQEVQRLNKGIKDKSSHGFKCVMQTKP